MRVVIVVRVAKINSVMISHCKMTLGLMVMGMTACELALKSLSGLPFCTYDASLSSRSLCDSDEQS